MRKSYMLAFLCVWLVWPGHGCGYDIQGDLGVKGKVTIQDSATKAPLNVTERSTAPSSPAAGDVYLDNGSNTASGNPGWRRYTGAGWEDVSASSGSSMTYPAAGIALSTGSAWGTSITNNSTNWNTAYSDRLKWDGGSSGLTASTGRASLGLTNMYDYGVNSAGTNGYVWKSNGPGGRGSWAIDQTGSAVYTEVDTYAELRDALQANNPWVMVTDNITLAGTITGGVSASSRLSFVYGKKITLGSYQLPIYGELDAGPHQVFVQSSTGQVTFPNRPPAYVYVEWWGGVGDDSTDNLTAFNNAIASLPNGEGGGVIKLLANATYRVSGEVLIQKNGVVIEGSGKRSTAVKKTSTGSNVNVFRWLGTSTTSLYGGGISNLTIYASSKTTSGAAVYLNYVSKFTISGIEVSGYPGASTSAYYLHDGIVSNTTWMLIVKDCLIETNGTGVWLTGTSDTTRTVDCSLYNIQSFASYGFEADYVEGIYSWDCVGSAGVYGLYIHPSSSAFVKNAWFNQFIADVNSQHGIYIYNSSSDNQAVDNINITNSWSVNAGYTEGGTPNAYDGVRVDGNVDKITNVKIIGSKIGYSGGYGIYMGQYPNYTIIANNEIFLNSRNSANVYDHIRLDGDMAFVSVNGNMLSQYGGQTKYGINVTSGTGAFFNITGNIITGYQTAPIYFAATGADNQIFGNSPKSTYDRLTIGGDFTVDGACSGCP